MKDNRTRSAWECSELSAIRRLFQLARCHFFNSLYSFGVAVHACCRSRICSRARNPNKEMSDFESVQGAASPVTGQNVRFGREFSAFAVLATNILAILSSRLASSINMDLSDRGRNRMGLTPAVFALLPLASFA